MTTIDLALTGARAKAKVSGPLTDGAVGIPVRITADEAWAELIPTLIARAGDTARQMVIDGEWNSVIPWECMIEGERLEIGVVGIDILEGNVRVPTTWADCGRVLPSPAGAEIGESRPEPTPDVVDQLEALAQSADRKGSRAVELAEDVRRRADEGEFKGEPGDDGRDGHSPYIGADGIWYVWIDALERYEPTGIRAQGPKGNPGEVDESKVSEAVADYMGAHPVQIPEEVRDGAAAGATALQPGDLASWAKQPNKPTYTFQDVGALPANTPIPPDLSDDVNELKDDLTHKLDISNPQTLMAEQQTALQEAIGILSVEEVLF